MMPDFLPIPYRSPRTKFPEPGSILMSEDNEEPSADFSRTRTNPSEGALTALRILIIQLLLLMTGTAHPAYSMEDEMKLDLRTAIGLALAESQELRDGRFSLQLAKLQRQLTYQAFFPSLSIAFTNSDTTAYDAADNNALNLKLSIAQPLFQGGRIAGSLRIQKLQLDHGREQLLAKADQITESCYIAYYSFLIQERKVGHQEVMLSNAHDQLDISRVELEIGKIREIDFLETELKVQAMAQSLEAQRLALNEAAYGLRQMLGLNPEQPFAVIDSLPEDYFGIELDHSADRLISFAMSSNTQITLKTLELEQKTVELKTARSRWLPSLSLEGAISLTGNGPPMQQSDYELSLNIEFPLPWISLGGSIKLAKSSTGDFGNSEIAYAKGPSDISYLPNVKSASMAFENERKNHQRLREDIRFQIRTSLNQYQSMRKSLNMSHDQVSILKRRLEILSLEADLGSSTRLDIVTAQNEYIKTLISLLEGTLELLMAERALERLIGIPFDTLHRLGDSR